jgi:hypothetical protein
MFISRFDRSFVRHRTEGRVRLVRSYWRDLAFVMRSIGYETTPIELEQMIRQVDQDGSRTTKSRAIGPVEHLLV